MILQGHGFLHTKSEASDMIRLVRCLFSSVQVSQFIGHGDISLPAFKLRQLHPCACMTYIVWFIPCDAGSDVHPSKEDY